MLASGSPGPANYFKSKHQLAAIAPIAHFAVNRRAREAEGKGGGRRRILESNSRLHA